MTDDSNLSDTESYALIDCFFERARWDYLGGDVEDELSGLPEPLLVAVRTASQYAICENPTVRLGVLKPTQGRPPPTAEPSVGANAEAIAC